MPRTDGAVVNNFDVLRLLFAAFVVLSHSFALVGESEPVVFGRTLGNVGVLGFFCVSGYLIAQSFGRRTSVPQFLANRFLRIVPGLVVALLVAYGLGRLFDGFRGNPVPFIVDGPVWTLTWEVVCYSALVVVGVLGVLSASGFPVFFAVAWVVYLTSIGNTSDFFLAVVPMFLTFGAGALLAVRGVRITTGWGIVASLGLLGTLKLGGVVLAISVLTRWVPFLYGPTVTPEVVQRVLFLVCFPIVLIWFATARRPGWRLRDDLSYGVYIYGWPVAQVVVAVAAGLHVGLAPWMLFLLTAVLVVPLAFLSWRFVERPSLSLKRRLRRPAGRVALGWRRVPRGRRRAGVAVADGTSDVEAASIRVGRTDGRA
ncbi:acyltransferase family protein [Curtobacterium sp. 22159]|uniref:acyltransferase family protein n=1 Tax=Curtobacterium sp. 22159 TaxID=3453882 RepID=UPI003F876F13